MEQYNLTDKQLAFVKEYMIDLNGTQAAIRAGYATKTAESAASRLLRNVKVNAALQQLKAERAERVLVDADYVLRRLTEIDQMDTLDILENDGSVKPIKEWPKIWRQFISGIDVSEVFDGPGDDRKLSGLIKKIKWPDKTKNLELIGKHVDVQAFKDQVGVSGAVEVINSVKTLLGSVDGKSWGLPGD